MRKLRRQLISACLCGGSLGIAGCFDSGEDTSQDAPSRQQGGFRGCGLSASSGAGGVGIGCGLLAGTGDTSFDSVFANEYELQKQFYGVSATYTFYDDCNGKNALAEFQTRRIYFGINLARDLLSRFGGGGLPVAFVLAHEFSHQLQFHFGWYDFNEPSVRDSELTADALANFYLLQAKSATNPANFNATLASIFDIGDYDFNNRNHHGTPLQRGAAALAGGEVALDFVSGRVGRSWPAVHDAIQRRIASIVSNPRYLADEPASSILN